MFAINEMKYGRYRMSPEHLRTGETHNLLYRFPFFRRVAVHRTCITGRLLLLERTPHQTFFSIGEQVTAVRAGNFLRMVFCTTINIYHQSNGFFLPLNSGKNTHFSVPTPFCYSLKETSSEIIHSIFY